MRKWVSVEILVLSGVNKCGGLLCEGKRILTWGIDPSQIFIGVHFYIFSFPVSAVEG